MAIDGRAIFKGAVKFVGSMAVGVLVTAGVRTNVIPKNKYEQIMIGIGNFVLSDMISVKAEEHLDNSCDKIFDVIDSFRGEPVKEIPPVEIELPELEIEKDLANRINEKLINNLKQNGAI